MTMADLERRVVDSAVYALCGSGSISSECRRDAAVLVLVWARASDSQVFDEQEVDAKTEEAYQYFEHGNSDHRPAPLWAVWDWPLV